MSDAIHDDQGRPTILEALLERHRPRLAAFLARNGANLLRWESVEDLVQDVHLRALRASPRFDYQGEEAFVGWLLLLARNHCADRFEYWRALKRNSGDVLRLTLGAGETVAGALDPAATDTGPMTHAWRREQLVVATRALAMLGERDRSLVEWASRGVPLAEQATRLGVSYDAVERAGRRAQERLRRTFELLVRRGRS